ncbi:N-acyl-D-glucosamine 2-epimerase [Segetibacter sp. 3557_3]|uniref:AGE family epimerase/isomerase n=1 Tax=Segetibacter sp. 3557_3 TaxID=2547429 RepID=UPI001058B0CE|nr:AGE family epimerase/isomerase [Segetibacter sp. 3557_3]TDH28542.1 N-acyl-D-glucosamine 2-epimerase [Segetibacter sp. 3557_3]
MELTLPAFKIEVQQELDRILTYWSNYAVDFKHGGFAGKISNDNQVDARAPKGSVLNSRILWSYSAAYNINKKAQYLQLAERAYKYMVNYFIDERYGGVFWTVDFEGKPLDTTKQVYAIAFAIYGLSEYYRASEEEQAKQLAMRLYDVVVKHNCDSQYGGYTEAFSREWKELEGLPGSHKDANENKSTDTHLHVLEAFANLYRIWPDKDLKQRIVELIKLFLNQIIHPVGNHLSLFFNKQWVPQGNTQSFGHDIEAAWLIQEAAEIIQDAALAEVVKARCVEVANAASRGLDVDGGLWLEYTFDDQHLGKEKLWWPQAEAMVGYYNVWQITGQEDYLQKAQGSWQFIKKHLLSPEGEWYWGVDANNAIMKGEDKVGMWKCPYHNSRACMEIISRIKS